MCIQMPHACAAYRDGMLSGRSSGILCGGFVPLLARGMRVRRPSSWFPLITLSPPALRDYVRDRTWIFDVALLALAVASMFLAIWYLVDLLAGPAGFPATASLWLWPVDVRTICPATFVAFLLLIAYSRRLARQYCAQVQALGYEVCPNCGYPLHGSPDDGHCPECNEPYCKRDLPRVWQQRNARYFKARNYGT